MLRTALWVSSITASLLCLNLAMAADVYKYVDEKGKVQYTDKPLKLPAERLNVQSQRTDTVAMEERVDEEAKGAAERDKARQAARKAQTDRKQTDETIGTGKVEACNKAREDYLNRMNALRLYEEQPGGERRYLDDAELDATRAAAKQSMDALCN